MDQMKPDGDGWGWSWHPDPLAQEVAQRLRELDEIAWQYEELCK